MLTDTEILSKLAEIIGTTFPGAGDISINATTTADDVPGWDSLNHALLLMNVERAFGIEFNPADVVDLENVGALALLVGSLLQEDHRQ
jgi:acyl carrier protein